MTTKTKRRYSIQQRRQAAHIEESYVKKGMPRNKAWAIAWTTIRKRAGLRAKSNCF